MRPLCCLFSLCLAFASLGPALAWAQGIVLSGSSGPACVQVQVAGQKPSPYACLNQQLQQQAQDASPTQPQLPLAANAPSNQVGTFNEQGLAEQFGQNFGKSVMPYRPDAPVYNNPLKP